MPFAVTEPHACETPEPRLITKYRNLWVCYENRGFGVCGKRWVAKENFDGWTWVPLRPWHREWWKHL